MCDLEGTRSLECVQSVRTRTQQHHMPPRNLAELRRVGICFLSTLTNVRATTPRARLRSAAFLPRAARAVARARASCVAWVASSTPGLRCTSCTEGEAAARAQAASIIHVTHRSGDSSLRSEQDGSAVRPEVYLRSAPWPLAALSAPLSSAGRADPMADPFPAIAARGL